MQDRLREIKMDGVSMISQTFRHKILNSLEEIQRDVLLGSGKPILGMEIIQIEDVSAFQNRFSSYSKRLNREVTDYNSSLEFFKFHEEEYKKGLALMNSENINSFKKAIEIFLSLGDYKKSKHLLQQCKDRVHVLAEAKKERIKAEATETKYQYALSLMRGGQYQEAVNSFDELCGYKDSLVLKTQCLKLMRKGGKVHKNPNTKIILVFLIGLILIIVGICLLFK